MKPQNPIACLPRSVKTSQIFQVLGAVRSMLFAVVLDDELAHPVHEVEPADPIPFVVADIDLQFEIIEPHPCEFEPHKGLVPRLRAFSRDFGRRSESHNAPVSSLTQRLDEIPHRHHRTRFALPAARQDQRIDCDHQLAEGQQVRRLDQSLQRTDAVPPDVEPEFFSDAPRTLRSVGSLA